MSVATDIQTAYETVRQEGATLLSKTQALLDTTESMSDEDGQILVGVREGLERMVSPIQAMIQKIQARLDS